MINQSHYQQGSLLAGTAWKRERRGWQCQGVGSANPFFLSSRRIRHHRVGEWCPHRYQRALHQGRTHISALQQQGIFPITEYNALNSRFKVARKASKLSTPEPTSSPKKTELLAAWNKTQRTARLKSMKAIPYPSQKIEDNPTARLRGEQERLLSHLYHTRFHKMRLKASRQKHPKDDESQGEE